MDNIGKTAGCLLFILFSFTLSSLIYFILTAPKHLSCSSSFSTCKSPSCPMSWVIFLPYWSCCHPVDLHITLKWFCFPHPPHVLPHAEHCWSGYSVPQYLHLSPFHVLWVWHGPAFAYSASQHQSLLLLLCH